MDKYPLNSDYVDNYLNYILLSISGSKISQDAFAFKNCVYMNPMSLTLTNCADRRDRINEFISDKKSLFESLKSKVAADCGNELIEAFLLDKNFNNGRDDYNIDARKNLLEKLNAKESSLVGCISKINDLSLI